MKTIRINTEAQIIPETVLAVSSPHHPYKLAWEINRMLNINLTQEDDFKQKEEKLFRVFSLVNEDDSYIKLVENTGKSGRLSNKFKNIDYFVAVSSADYPIKLKEIKQNLLRSALISGIFEITADRNIKTMLKSV